jgi:hypothetical protein
MISRHRLNKLVIMFDILLGSCSLTHISQNIATARLGTMVVIIPRLTGERE